MAKSEKTKKHFFKDFKAELKKVIWPTPKQIVNNTVAVVVIVVITAAIVFVLDSVFDLANTFGINKLKQSIKDKVSSDVETVEEVSSDDEDTEIEIDETENSVEE